MESIIETVLVAIVIIMFILLVVIKSMTRSNNIEHSNSNHVIELVSKGELLDAIKMTELILRDKDENLHHDVLVLLMQWNDLDREFRQGVVTREKFICDKNIIARRLLQITDNLKWKQI